MLEQPDSPEQLDVEFLSHADLLGYFAEEHPAIDRQLLAYPGIEDALREALRIMEGMSGDWLEYRMKEMLREARVRTGEVARAAAASPGAGMGWIVQGYRGLFVGVVLGVGGTLLSMPRPEKPEIPPPVARPAAPAKAPLPVHIRFGAQTQELPPVKE